MLGLLLNRRLRAAIFQGLTLGNKLSRPGGRFVLKKLLNTLFVTTQGSYLSKDGECVVISIESQERLRIPVHALGSIVCFGNVLCSPFLLGHCSENGVAISFLSVNGRFLARVIGCVSGNVLLRREQYRRADDEAASVLIARSSIIGKTINSRTILQRAIRDHSETIPTERMVASVDYLARQIEMLRSAETLDQLRGLEGDSSRRYFGVFDDLITNDKEHFFMHERNRRPPLDNMNALLSFLYTLLAHDCASALESVGLDPQAGFLHRDRPGRASLALDLMEEFRPFLADRQALSLVNLRQVSAQGFKKSDTGAVEMNEDTRKEVILAWQKRKQEEIQHRFLNESVPIGLLPYTQALLLSRYLRGDLDGYPPFIWK
jgi:CRISPR-associated protein Cas1